MCFGAPRTSGETLHPRIITRELAGRLIRNGYNSYRASNDISNTESSSEENHNDNGVPEDESRFLDIEAEVANDDHDNRTSREIRTRSIPYDINDIPEIRDNRNQGDN